MSLKDDFLEALRSVKRDFFRESEYTDQNKQTSASSAETPATAETYKPTVNFKNQTEVTPPTELPNQTPIDLNLSDDVVFEAFKQASTIDDNQSFNNANEFAADTDDEDSYDATPGDTTPYRSFNDTGLSKGSYQSQPSSADERRILDFDTSGIYGDDKTIISKNTVIRGALQTEDSVRLLGQILGDIDCKSNIVVAGKVRGNTTAANAYIFDAQVDGDVRCDDIINISNDAWILGNIRAQQAEIDGKIKGNIEIRHMVSIGASSSVLGDISADEIEIKRGAFINGQIMMYSPSRDVLDRFDQFER